MSKQILCETCKFWSPIMTKADSIKVYYSWDGQCRRHAPRPDMRGGEHDDNACWPVADSEAWCGEHQPKGRGA